MTRKRAIKLLMSVAEDGCAHRAAAALDNISGGTNQKKVLLAMGRWMSYAVQEDNVYLFARCDRALRSFGWCAKLKPDSSGHIVAVVMQPVADAEAAK